MAICTVCVVKKEEEIDPVLNMFKEKYKQHCQVVDYLCLQKYNQHNEHFSMGVATINEKEEGEEGNGNEQVTGYYCTYQYETHELKLEYDISTETWTKVLDKYHDGEEQPLKAILDHINSYQKLDEHFTLDKQIQMIMERFDNYFLELDQAKEAEENKIKTSITSSVSQKDNGIKYLNNVFALYQASASSTIPEVDEQQQRFCANLPENDVGDHDFHEVLPGACEKISKLTPPRRSRPNSECSTQSSIRYTSFIPPPAAPVRRRHVIESILLRVQRKKKTFEKMLDTLKQTAPPPMHELGLEFLRLYDGKFNYREGHTFVMLFRNKTWFLTIEQIKCVDSPLGESGPQSILILNYKGQCTNVHV